MITEIGRSLEAITQLVDAVEANFPGATTEDQDEYVKQLRLLNSWTRVMHRGLPWVSHATNPDLELGALYFIDEVGHDITGLRLDAIPNPSDQFSTLRRPFQLISEALELDPEPGPIPVILNYPATESAAHFLLPLYGHELAHAVVGEKELQLRAIAAHQNHQELQDAFAKAVGQISGGDGGSKAAAIRLRSRLQRWTIELLCDQFAVQWFGPSFLYSFASFVLALSWNEPLERHPPTTIRIKHLLNLLESKGWTSLMDQQTPHILAWMKEVGSTDPKPLDTEGRFLVDAVEILAPTVSDVVSSELKSTSYEPASFEGVAAFLEDLITHETLPVQDASEEAIDRRAILLSAWFSVLENRDEASVLAEVPGDLKTQAFFAKAIEMSAVLARFREL